MAQETYLLVHQKIHHHRRRLHHHHHFLALLLFYWVTSLLSWQILELKNKEMFLFNNALNPFYLRFYGVGHMVMDHSDSE